MAVRLLQRRGGNGGYGDHSSSKTHFSKLADRAHAGEEILIAKAGVPWARLVPLQQLPERRPGLLVGRVGADFSSRCLKVSCKHGTSDGSTGYPHAVVVAV